MVKSFEELKGSSKITEEERANIENIVRKTLAPNDEFSVNVYGEPDREKDPYDYVVAVIIKKD